MKYTAEGLAAYAEFCLGKKTKYMFGALMEPITEALIERVTSRYPSHYPPERVEELRACIGTECYGTDCSGLIKSYYWGGIGSEGYDEGTDWNSGRLLNGSVKRGGMKTLPEVPGICLYMKGHVGIYAGNGKVIQSTRSEKFGDGVVCVALEDQKWLEWFFCPLLTYPELPKVNRGTAASNTSKRSKSKKTMFVKLKKVKNIGTTVKKIKHEAKVAASYTKKSTMKEMLNIVQQCYVRKMAPEEQMARRILSVERNTDCLISEQEYYEIGLQINNARYQGAVTDKICLLTRMGTLIKRGYLDLSEASDEQVVSFCEKYGAIIAKEPWKAGGRGILVYPKLPEGEALHALIKTWREKPRVLLEELLVPHPALAAIFPDSLCTVRIHTLFCGNKAKIVLNSSIRFGRKGSLIDLCDNSYTLYLDESGNVLSGGAMNKFSLGLEQKHGDTGAEFSEVTIPYWNQCCEVVKEAAKRVPEVPFVAWDVAITKEGVELIEGNFLSGNVLPQQLYLIMTGRNKGLRPALENIREYAVENGEDK